MISSNRCAGLLPGKPEHDRVDDDVVVRGQLGVETNPQLDERRQPAADGQVSAAVRVVHPVDAGEALEQRALPAPVPSHDAEHLALLDLERDVLDRSEFVEVAEAKRMKGPLFESVDLEARNAEGLANSSYDDCRRFLGASCAGRRALFG